MIVWGTCGIEMLHTSGHMPGRRPAPPRPPGCPQGWVRVATAGCHHSRLVFNGCANFVRPRAASSASAGSLFPRFWLHRRCAKRQFLRSYGSPPRLTGSISSTSGDAGEPCLSFTSTNPPQSQQFVSSLSTCALSLFRFVPLDLLGSLMSSPSSRVLV